MKLSPKYFLYFYRHLGPRVFLVLLASISVGILDGFGLAMFLPLLQLVNGDAVESHESLGRLGFLVDGLENFGLSINLITVLGVMLLFFVLKGIARYFEGYYRLVIQQYFIKKLRFQSVNDLSAFDFEAFTLSDPGRIQNTLSGEVTRVVGAFRAYFASLQSGVMLGVYVFLAFTANPQFAVLVTVGGALSNFLFRVIYKKTQALSRKVTKDGHDFQGLIIQMVANFKYLKATGLSDHYAKKVKKSVDIIEKSNKTIGVYNAILTAVREPIVITIVVAVIIIQVNYMGQDLGPIILSLLFFYRSLTFILNLQTEWNKFLNVSGALENMSDFHHELVENREEQGEKTIHRFKDAINLDKVSFGYKSAEVLKEVSLIIHKNTTVALVGESGSGKTTLVNLICGLLKPTSGNVFIDGVSCQEYTTNSLRSRFGYITQEPVIFNATIFENVTFWSEPTVENMERFKMALKKASIYDFVFSQPLAENEILGHSGINLSGGQKQRISIARELYKEVDILLLDEATSALDSETEKEIKSSLNALKGEYTIIIIAHRFATIKDANQIVILNKGHVEATGNYEELMNDSSNFKTMATLQEL